MFQLALAILMATVVHPQSFETLVKEDSSIFPGDGIVGSNAGAHDPSVVEFGHQFFCFATGREGFGLLKSSSDLVHWKDWGSIMPATPEWLRVRIPQHTSIWAPMALRWGSGLRMYYCASERFGHNGSVIGVADNPNFNPNRPQDGWTDLGMVIQSIDGKDDFNAIDPDVCIGPDGRQWLVFGSYWSGIFLAELNPATGGLMSPDRPPIHVASNPTERGNPLEAPSMIYRDGFYYLFVTYGLAAQGVRSTYRTMVGRARKAEGPYLGFDDRPMTEGGHADLIKSSPPMFGPGGGNFFETHDGKWFMSYHFYDSRLHWHGDVWGRPMMQVREMVWGPDGWPLPGLPAGVDLLRPQQPTIVGSWRQQVDFGDPNDLVLERDGSARLGLQIGHYTLSGTSLVIRWPKAASPNTGSTPAISVADDWIDTLTLDPTEQFFVGRNQTGAIIRGIKLDAQVRKL